MANSNFQVKEKVKNLGGLEISEVGEFMSLELSLKDFFLEENVSLNSLKCRIEVVRSSDLPHGTF